MIVYRIARVLFTLYFRLLNRVIVRGKERQVADGPVIVYANHVSNADVFLLTMVFRRQIRFMAKKNLFDAPIVRPFAKGFGAFPVDRDRADLTAVKTAIRILRAGGVLGIFPEGTRITGDKVSDPKGGVAMLAWKTDAMLTPVHFTYKRRLMLFNHIEMTIGSPISTAELSIQNGTAEEFKAAGEELIRRAYAL